jgi:secretion/DNA translocation related CpaE-like protein
MAKYVGGGVARFLRGIVEQAPDPHFIAVAVVGGCGGAGASSLAAVLALATATVFAEQGRDAICTLVDLDPLSGGLDLLLGSEREPGPRWSGLHLAGGSLDPAELVHALPRCLGVAVLSADVDVQQSAESVAQVIQACRTQGPVVVDVARWHSSARTTALAECAGVIVVAPPELRAFVATNRVIQGIARVTWPPQEPALLMRGAGPGMKPARVAEMLGVAAVGGLPEDPAFTYAGGVANAPLSRATRRVVATLAAALAS